MNGCGHEHVCDRCGRRYGCWLPECQGLRGCTCAGYCHCVAILPADPVQHDKDKVTHRGPAGHKPASE